jgi:3-oxocholest-4-en-26-oyl-CoA dehydrogenase alpha subunit
VDMRSPGVTVRPLISLSGIHSFNEVFFDNVRVPAANLVGEENKGFYMLIPALAIERLSVAPHIVGQCKRMLELLVRYCKENSSGGKSLASDPVVRRKHAERAI